VLGDSIKTLALVASGLTGWKYVYNGDNRVFFSYY
jgi:hypothetical protein